MTIFGEKERRIQMEMYADIEAGIKSSLAKKFSETTFNLWFKDLLVIEVTSEKIVFSTTTPFKQEMLMTNQRKNLEDAIRETLGFSLQIEVQNREASPIEIANIIVGKDDPDEVEAQKREDEIRDTITSQIQGKEIISDYTFENFVVGDSNMFAVAACRAVAISFEPEIEQKLDEKYNPLFIYGQSGLGKTHLLYAVTNEIKRNKPNVRILYTRGEDFMNELIESINDGRMIEFRSRYRNVDVLLIDDIQFIAGKKSTQDEFFHVFNTLYDMQKQIILTSDRPPYEIKNLADRLMSRFEWGLIADIQPPSPELRAAIIKMKADRMNLPLTKEIIIYMAEKIKSDIRTIEGALKKIHALSVLCHTDITLDLVKRSLSDMGTAGMPDAYIVDRIFNTVSKHTDIPVDSIKSGRRQANILYARQLCIFLIRSMTRFSLTEIGGLFNRDHATILNAYNKIEHMMETDPEIKAEVEDLQKKISAK